MTEENGVYEIERKTIYRYIADLGNEEVLETSGRTELEARKKGRMVIMLSGYQHIISERIEKLVD